MPALGRLLAGRVSLGGDRPCGASNHQLPLICHPMHRRRRSSCLWRGDISSSQVAGASPECPRLSER